MKTSNSVRSRNRVRFDKSVHYQNYAEKYVDGKSVLEPSEVVLPSLAAEHSVTMNLLSAGSPKSLRQRVNVDAVDLPETLSKLS